jgi:ABC-2 type transport system ATP-binding protein
MKETIVIQSISKGFKDKAKIRHILDKLSFTVLKGEVFGFIGPNGAGKSTLINLLMGFIAQDEGTININKLASHNVDCHRLIGYLPEDPRFYNQLNAKDHLFFAGKASGLTSREIKQKTDSLLDRLLLLHAKNQSVNTYSKGMKQRLGIAMALIHDPQIFILDEPMSGLDPMGRKLVADIILNLKEKEKTVFFSSHILNDIQSLCDRIAILNKGRMLYCGEVEDFDTSNNTFEQAFIDLVRTDNQSREAA